MCLPSLRDLARQIQASKRASERALNRSFAFSGSDAKDRCSAVIIGSVQKRYDRVKTNVVVSCRIECCSFGWTDAGLGSECLEPSGCEEGAQLAVVSINVQSDYRKPRMDKTKVATQRRGVSVAFSFCFVGRDSC